MCIECQKYAVIKLQDFCQYEDKNKEKSLRYIFFSTLGVILIIECILFGMFVIAIGCDQVG
jgi:hypothetical protein